MAEKESAGLLEPHFMEADALRASAYRERGWRMIRRLGLESESLPYFTKCPWASSAQLTEPQFLPHLYNIAIALGLFGALHEIMYIGEITPIL